ncbi:tRNA (adenosine(37)-N6)-threonylcarbamoyltransferase complex dimerization subunit type 1 TsaB [Peptoniphilus catoniae]|uniref:tRNA (adenosine(37)-N6)-threonylcarbamoyltransferase complex dimerization subunit type 1 TsaB n=1 Tax=Peptoniphilus catoniae TaxID=1660341 RepID=UPI0010FE42AE|nr:tRNA (adenosine(37)-N6)-threonylcarbamoyltransferase complex dimerization subunit type 1 TsaB [Peptoniphilus catoniae]
MITLGLDTSTMRTSVGLAYDNEEIASFEITSSVNNSEDLVDMVDDIFNKLKITISDVDLIGVGIGPGSYTGTRIAVTVARTLAQALNKEIKAVSSLKSLALNYQGDRRVLSLVDARRNRAYYGLYKNSEGIPVDLSCDGVEEVESLRNRLKGERLLLLGTGADKFKDFFAEEADVATIPDRYIKGSNIARLAYLEYKRTGGDNLLEVLPNYVTKSQAERELEKKEAGLNEVD